VDGGRFDYVDKGNHIPDLAEAINNMPKDCFYGFPVDGGAKYFNMRNVVSITEKEVDDA